MKCKVSFYIDNDFYSFIIKGSSIKKLRKKMKKEIKKRDLKIKRNRIWPIIINEKE